MEKPVPKRRKKAVRLIMALAILTAGVWMIWSNSTVGTTVYEIEKESLPAAFDGMRIAQISDLHNARFGRDHLAVIGILKENKPDLIVMTGDLVDSYHMDRDAAVSLVRQAVQIAPCYYVTGNHEAWIGGAYRELETLLEDCGVTVLHNRSVQIDRDGASIRLIGVDDPDFTDPSSTLSDLTAGVMASRIERAGADGGFQILLSHRPEELETYAGKGMDLVLAGHAHGGQFRLPFLGGLAAPNQGLFPKYDGGVYYAGNTAMVVSRGIGNSVIPVRFNNRPEIVFVVLHKSEDSAPGE